MKMIVSIQGHSQRANKELADKVLLEGVNYIRTDSNIHNRKQTLGLKKDKTYEYYITPTIEYIDQVHKWAKYVCIDCRRNNPNINVLIQHCIDNNIKYVADIESLDDVKNIIDRKPSFVSTTFCHSKIDKLKIIREIKEHVQNIPPVIAEGGYSLQKKEEIEYLKKLDIDFLCVGKDISGIDLITNDYMKLLDSEKKERSKIIAVDIDDTIFSYISAADRKSYNNPVPNYAEIFKINQLIKTNLIFYYTGRNWGLYDKTYIQLREVGCKLDQLVCGKLPFSYYIDKDALKSISEL